MVYTDYDKPSENMNISQREISSMIREQQEELYNNEQEKILAEQSRLDREREANANWLQEYTENQISGRRTRADFLEKVKNGFLSEAMCKLFKDSFGVMTKREQITARNLINQFINEQGAGELINRFKYQNTLIAEMARIVQKHYDMVIESISPSDEEEARIPGRAK